SLPESDADALGAHQGTVYVSALRHGPPESMALYAVSQAGGRSRRVGAEEGGFPATLRSDGTLLWAGQSRDSSNQTIVSCVRARKPDGSTSTIADWLPARGRVVTSDSDIFYVDSEVQPHASIWRIHSNAELPQRISLPAGYWPLAID